MAAVTVTNFSNLLARNVQGSFFGRNGISA